ncbi:sodium/sugar symporter [Hyphobacterium sp. CCMP332]|uniref:sodium/sugar symporter n=1 Tax=Hyphobacterium sp. CCMP332 TaxID=2749086 RepID=UPI001650BFE4|nr:sodium/sugar symporter [Hyphobacterium sp. CCMP332]QNL19665.1 sodium/sugar symporter [Hyphobacterium sp. CCMP332]
MTLEPIDLAIVFGYALALIAIALFVSREKAGHAKNSTDYFLAGKALPWWAVGASLIAANISAEQIIGQSGQGYVVGLAIAAYELQAAIVLLIVAKYFLPIFLERNIYTMPQFLDQRFGGGVKSVMAVFWIALYTAVNLTSVLWLGGLAINAVSGLGVWPAMAALAAFAVVYSIYGGLKAVALTDIIQVIVLIAGGILITWISLSLVGEGAGPVSGFATLMNEIPDHFNMILNPEHPSYSNLPGIWTLLGGLWVLHFSYWGFNQYIIQRALGSKSLSEARKGLAFAASLKLLIPVIVVVPGIAALYLAQNGLIDQSALDARPDSTYGVLMTLVPTGIRGLVFAALIAAIVSSLASMMNSISTIFTMDLYRSIRSDKPEHHYVTVGRITAFSAMAIALMLAQPFLGGMESAFQTIQEYTGFIAPGIVAVFLLGFFWKRTNTSGAFALLISSVVLSFLFWLMANPAAMGGAGAGLLTMLGLEALDLPFVIRIWIVFMACVVIGVGVSLITAKPAEHRPVELGGIRFATEPVFNLASLAIIAVLIAIYGVFW